MPLPTRRKKHGKRYLPVKGTLSPGEAMVSLLGNVRWKVKSPTCTLHYTEYMTCVYMYAIRIPFIDDTLVVGPSEQMKYKPITVHIISGNTTRNLGKSLSCWLLWRAIYYRPKVNIFPFEEWYNHFLAICRKSFLYNNCQISHTLFVKCLSLITVQTQMTCRYWKISPNFLQLV